MCYYYYTYTYDTHLRLISCSLYQVYMHLLIKIEIEYKIISKFKGYVEKIDKFHTDMSSQAQRN